MSLIARPSPVPAPAAQASRKGLGGCKAELAKGAVGSGRGHGSREQLEGEEILVGKAPRPRL